MEKEKKNQGILGRNSMNCSKKIFGISAIYGSKAKFCFGAQDGNPGETVTINSYVKSIYPSKSVLIIWVERKRRKAVHASLQQDY